MRISGSWDELDDSGIGIYGKRKLNRERRGGFLFYGTSGRLIGDALGVPYEFYRADELPGYEEIEMVPPAGFQKTYKDVEAGTWSDDGVQALCLLDSLLRAGRFSLKDFSESVSSWYEDGVWAVDGKVFDVGIQTANALNAYKKGVCPEECGFLKPEGKGNGALMRVLPLVLWHNLCRGGEDRESLACGSDEGQDRGQAQGSRDRASGDSGSGSRDRDRQLVLDAHRQCLITHGNICNQVCCALYCLVASRLMDGLDARQAVGRGVADLRRIYEDMPEYKRSLEWSVRPDLPWQGQGTGYVVDCMRSAFMILMEADSYEDGVKRAVLLGNHTDTTACVLGGLSGILYGIQGIPGRWISMLRERDKVEGLLGSLFNRAGE